MRIIGLLSWYEESPSWLAECVASAAKLCDHIIAVDGPYASFPGALRKPVSGVDQVDTIVRTANGAGIGCTVHVPRQPWWSGEVGKRDFMFRLGATFAEPDDDWFLRIDADEILAHVPADTRQLLAATDCDVAEVTIFERGDEDTRHPFRCLFRAIPGIAIEQAHYVVTVPGPRVLAGNGTVHTLEPAEALTDVVLEHRTQHRPSARKSQKASYYACLPDIEKVEAL